MSDSDIRALANSRGYTLSGSDLVSSFLDEQELYYIFTQNELSGLTIAEITYIANTRGYMITQTLKADIIQEFLDQQS